VSPPPSPSPDDPDVAAQGLPIAALRRFAAARGACELCGRAVGDRHPHAADVAGRTLRCCCTDCHGRLPATEGPLRAVPDRVVSGTADEAAWDAVDAPVALVFMLLDDHGHATAFYPSPAGPTESLLPRASWSTLMERVALATDLVPEVEALLLDKRRRPVRAHIIPVDRCYELVGRLRRDWHGMDGGPVVDAALAEVLRDAEEAA